MTEFSVSIEAPVDEVFAYVTDYRNVTQYMEGVAAWEPVDADSDPADHGVGTVYQLVLRGGPKKVVSEVEITQGVDNELLHWESHSGLRTTGTWRFEPDGQGTTVPFAQTIVPPGRAAGKLLAQSLEPVIRAQYRRSLDTLEQQLEARAA